MWQTARPNTQIAAPINRRIKLAFIITGLSTGGAEMMLYKLLSRLNREQFEPVVISLRDYGTLGDRFTALAIPVYTIGMKSGIPTPVAIWRLIEIMRRLNPDLLQGWMYHGNLAALLATFTLKTVPLIWSIRHSVYSLKYDKPSTAVVIRLLAQLSNLPRKILYNSKISANQHEKIGYKPDKTLVIPNGFDTDLFIPSVVARQAMRVELALPENTLFIGLMGRYHPMKDHANFLQAAAIVLQQFPDVYFVLAGREINAQNTALAHLIQTLKLKERIHLLGERQDMPHLTASLDIAVCASYSEGFPNIVGEAMSCGVPTVVTDVGDSAWIVGKTGRVVPPKHPELLANALKELIELGSVGREALGQAARKRIVENFSLESVVAQYEALYSSLFATKLN